MIKVLQWFVPIVFWHTDGPIETALLGHLCFFKSTLHDPVSMKPCNAQLPIHSHATLYRR